jgi:hypothetical protein
MGVAARPGIGPTVRIPSPETSCVPAGSARLGAHGYRQFPEWLPRRSIWWRMERCWDERWVPKLSVPGGLP